MSQDDPALQVGEQIVAACRSGSEDVVIEHLAAGFDVNALCSSRAAGFRAPAIWWASESGQASVVRALLSRGASTEARSCSHCPRLSQWLPRLLSSACVACLAFPKLCFVFSLQTVDERESTTALHRAAYGGHYAALDLLLSAGASTRVVSRQGNSPLHLAGTAARPSVIPAEQQDPTGTDKAYVSFLQRKRARRTA